VPMMGCALSTRLAGMEQVVLIEEGAPGHAEAADALERAIGCRYLPFSIGLRLSADARQRLRGLLPAVAAMTPVGGRPAVYICRDWACRQPVTSVADVERALAPGERPPRPA